MQRKHNKLEDVFIAYQEIQVSRIFETKNKYNLLNLRYIINFN
jgi:hypothetical protein